MVMTWDKVRDHIEEWEVDGKRINKHRYYG